MPAAARYNATGEPSPPVPMTSAVAMPTATKNSVAIGRTQNERVNAVSACFQAAGFKSPVLDNIRAEMWLKLWGNLSFNPISALTHATLEQICRFGPTRSLAAAMMREAQTVAEKLGVRFKISLEQRIAGAEAVGAHKTSMLQDVEHGRALELEALVGSVVELGRITGTPTPTIDAIYAATSLLAQTLAAQKGRLEAERLGSATIQWPAELMARTKEGYPRVVVTFPPKTRPLAWKFHCAEMGPRGGGHETETAHGGTDHCSAQGRPGGYRSPGALSQTRDLGRDLL